MKTSKLILCSLFCLSLFSCNQKTKTEPSVKVDVPIVIAANLRKALIKTETQTIYEVMDRLNVLTKDDMRSQFIFEYNRKGLRTKENVYDEKGELLRTGNYEYDTINYVYKHNDYNADGSLRFSEIGSFDKGGKYISGKSFDWKGIFSDTLNYVYNPKGELIEKIDHSLQGHFNTTDIYQYDKEGNETNSEKSFQGRDGVYHSVNVYISKILARDKEGNWIKKIEYKGGRPDGIYEREITYY
jgi:hypothetical protein